MFLDCSKSDDARGCGLPGLRWSPVRVGDVGSARPVSSVRPGRVPREKVDARVTETMETRQNVVAFFGDPSHVLGR
jgi:hypothetical protein